MATRRKSKRTKRKYITVAPKIERGLKIPSPRGRGPSPLLLAAAKMSVKDSFLGGSVTTVTMLNKKLKPKRFTSRMTNKKRRIWRVK